MPIASLKVWRNKNQKVNEKALLDIALQCTFVSKHLTTDFKLKPVGKVNLKVSGFVGKPQLFEYDVVNFNLQIRRMYHIIQDCVKTELPSVQVDGLMKATQLLESKGVWLNNTEITNDYVRDVDILIGADHCGKIVIGH